MSVARDKYRYFGADLRFAPDESTPDRGSTISACSREIDCRLEKCKSLRPIAIPENIISGKANADCRGKN
jgi:hypothetical protein